jgi:RNA polymerase sigma-70 factor (ECF subfamily)
MQTTFIAPGSAAVEGSDADMQVIARVCAGHVDAFEVLMRRYNRLVFRTVRSISRSDAEAEDVAQDAWIAAYQHLAQFEGKAAFSTWVTRIAIRIAIARARRQRNQESLDATSMEHDADDDPLRTLHRRELAALLERAIDALPVDYRVVLMLRDVEQLSTAQAAESLGVSEENVRVRLHRSRAALRESLLHEEFQGAMGDAFAFDGQRCNRMVTAVLSRLRRSS